MVIITKYRKVRKNMCKLVRISKIGVYGMIRMTRVLKEEVNYIELVEKCSYKVRVSRKIYK